MKKSRCHLFCHPVKSLSKNPFFASSQNIHIDFYGKEVYTDTIIFDTYGGFV